MALKRKLGFWDVFAIAAGAMISSGLFVLPGQASVAAGPAVVLAYALAAVMMIPALLSQSELVTAMPKSGGSYFFIERSLGALPGTLAGFANWLSLALKSAFAMVGIGAFARLIWPDADLSTQQWEWLIKFVATGCCVLFGILNCMSVKLAGKAQFFMVVGLLIVLVIFVVVGLPNVNQHPNFDNFLAKGFGSVFGTAGLVFVSFGGLTKAASIGEEVRNPSKNLPGAMFLAFIIVSALYVSAVFVTVGTLGASMSAGPYGDLTPLSSAAGKFMGRGGLLLLSAAGILAFVTTGNGGILAASRSPLAMSNDGLLPRSLGKISAAYGTPYISVILTTCFMIAMILLLSIGDLVKVASTMMLILFLLVNVAVLIMRGSKIQNYRPRYRSPLFPWIQLVGIGVYGVLIIELIAMLGPVPLITTGTFIVAGLLWYLFYVSRRSQRESALVYMVKNIVAPAIRRGRLEDELRAIATERDEIIHDRFDFIVKDCEILDLPGPTSADKMFHQVSAVLAERLNLDSAVLLEKLKTREADSSTVIQPGLAIPHIIVEGHHLFDLVLIRCREGIIFDVDKPYVKTVFILVGSSDERNYHLRALMAIAQVVQEKDFSQNWLAAPNVESLRDLVLLSGRTRDKT